MTAKFLDHNRHGELKQWRRRRQRKRQRSNQFRLAKQQRYTSITLFVHSGPSLHDCGRKLPIFTRPLYGVGEHSAKFSFFFFYQIQSFWTQPQTRISQTFDKLNEIEWDRWSLKQSQFTFLSGVFGLLSLWSFATMATRVTASLYWGCLKLVSSLTVFQSSLLSSATFDIIFSLTPNCNLAIHKYFS